jgi:hypothetical protein
MLSPRREGVIGIPSIQVGGARTAPLSLTVTPSAATPARAGERVFIEVEVDDRAPYVQQAVGVVVRLFYAMPLVSGQLDQDPPEGASLQRVGDDLRFTRELAGRRYEVVERRLLLIPETSGDLVLPGARFSGRGVPGFFDEIFNGGVGDALTARAAPVRMQVQPIPADAAQPWLPLHDLRLRYAATPQSARAGEAATVSIELVADGAGAAQLPELDLQVGGGAQVFGEPARADERFRDGRPQATVVRRFSIVPARPGALEIPGPRVQWWDVAEDRLRTTQLPPLVVDVAPGQGGFARQAPPDACPASRAKCARGRWRRSCSPCCGCSRLPGACTGAAPMPRWRNIPPGIRTRPSAARTTPRSDARCTTATCTPSRTHYGLPRRRPPGTWRPSAVSSAIPRSARRSMRCSGPAGAMAIRRPRVPHSGPRSRRVRAGPGWMPAPVSRCLRFIRAES